MQGALTKAGAELALNRAFRNTGTSPTNLYLGLATQPVAADATLAEVTEISTPGYARQLITFGAPSGTSPVQVANDAQVQFDFSGDPPAVSYAFVASTASGTAGTIVARWTGNTIDAAAGESIRVLVGDLIMRLTTAEAA
jgi:hypothetical protein